MQQPALTATLQARQRASISCHTTRQPRKFADTRASQSLRTVSHTLLPLNESTGWVPLACASTVPIEGRETQRRKYGPKQQLQPLEPQHAASNHALQHFSGGSSSLGCWCLCGGPACCEGPQLGPLQALLLCRQVHMTHAWVDFQRLSLALSSLSVMLPAPRP